LSMKQHHLIQITRTRPQPAPRDLLSCAVALPAHLDRLARRDQS
jgi:hypothetical protein